MPFKVLFDSLVNTNSLQSCDGIYIIHGDELSDGRVASVSIFLNGYGYKPCFLNASHLLPSSIPLKDSDHVSKATYYRLYCHRLVPDHVSSAVYIDVDTFACGSIDKLFSLELKSPIAATDHCSPVDQLRLWGVVGGLYFQAGVLVIDLQYWRKSNMEVVFNAIITNSKDKILWWDQDVLNLAFANNWQRIPLTFNANQHLFACLELDPPQNIHLDCVFKDIKLIHFDGPNKPWANGLNRPFANLWLDAYEALFNSPYHFEELKKVPPVLHWKMKVKLYVHSILVKLHLRESSN